MFKAIRSLLARVFNLRKFSIQKPINLDNIISEEEIFEELNDN
jgi:hypothetical protein